MQKTNAFALVTFVVSENMDSPDSLDSVLSNNNNDLS